MDLFVNIPIFFDTSRYFFKKKKKVGTNKKYMIIM